MKQVGIKQPLLGLLATVIVFFIAFALIIMFNTPMFLSWACCLALTIIPIQIIVGLGLAEQLSASCGKAGTAHERALSHC